MRNKRLFTQQFIFFLLYPSGFQSQAKCFQSGGDIQKPGDSLEISCKASGSSFGVYWLS
uniref:Ig-like domain-containing protein n=1 Tax=Dromaius novaehollandiae TaxID=8790 RepID=A0A8C4JSQ1_DRONO